MHVFGFFRSSQSTQRDPTETQGEYANHSKKVSDEGDGNHCTTVHPHLKQHRNKTYLHFTLFTLHSLPAVFPATVCFVSIQAFPAFYFT